MFKLLMLQQLYNISDEELEYQVSDRLSFMQFLGFGLADEVPEATTVWLFRKQLIEQELIEPLFEQFDGYLIEQGYAAQGGQIVDATLIPVPKQHNSKAENECIKGKEVPSDWQEKPHKRSQKNTDARWTKKRGKSYFGYKNHIGIDAEHRLIRRYVVTDASVHDLQVLGQLLDEDNDSDTIWGDSAYRSEDTDDTLKLYLTFPVKSVLQAANLHRGRVILTNLATGLGYRWGFYFDVRGSHQDERQLQQPN